MPSNYGVFDGITIQAMAYDPAPTTIDRTSGPLEHGAFDPSTGHWVPVEGPQPILAAGAPGIPGFGIDGDGNPYYDTQGASPGDQAGLWCDPTNGIVAGCTWLEAVSS